MDDLRFLDLRFLSFSLSLAQRVIVATSHSHYQVCFMTDTHTQTSNRTRVCVFCLFLLVVVMFQVPFVLFLFYVCFVIDAETKTENKSRAPLGTANVFGTAELYCNTDKCLYRQVGFILFDLLPLVAGYNYMSFVFC